MSHIEMEYAKTLRDLAEAQAEIVRLKGEAESWEKVVDALRAALAEPEQEYICKCGLRVVSHQCKTDKEF